MVKKVTFILDQYCKMITFNKTGRTEYLIDRAIFLMSF